MGVLLRLLGRWARNIDKSEENLLEKYMNLTGLARDITTVYLIYNS